MRLRPAIPIRSVSEEPLLARRKRGGAGEAIELKEGSTEYRVRSTQEVAPALSLVPITVLLFLIPISIFLQVLFRHLSSLFE